MPVKARPVIDRVLDRCVEASDGCWVFQGAKSEGYGYVGAGPRGTGCIHTHRVTYAHFVADVPHGLDLDHLCRNRACCNPWHLEPVSRKVNVARGLRSPGYGLRTITHCKHGHEYTPENTSTSISADGYPRRRCRACAKARYDARKQAA